MNLPDQTVDIDTLWDFDHPDQSEKRFQELLATLGDSEEREKDESFQAELLTQIARAKALQGNLDEAESLLQEAEGLVNLSQTSQNISRIRYLLERGRLYILRKTPSQARSLFIEAWTLAGQIKADFYSIDAARMLAAIEPQKAQKEWINQALSLAETSLEARANQCLGDLYATCGWAQYEMRQFEGALDTFYRSLKCVQERGTPRKVVLAKWAIAKTLRALSRFEEALKIQKELLSEVSTLNQRDGYIYEELAECLQSLKRANEAQIYFDLAYHELSKDEWLTDNKPERIKRLKSLGKSK